MQGYSTMKYDKSKIDNSEINPFVTIGVFILVIAIIGIGFWYFFIRTEKHNIILKDDITVHYFEALVSTNPGDYIKNSDQDLINSLVLSINGETDYSKIEGAAINNQNELWLPINKYTYTLSNENQSVDFEVDVVDNKAPFFLYYPANIRIVVDAIDFTFPDFFAALDYSGAKIVTDDKETVNINKIGAYHMKVSATDNYDNTNGGNITVTVVSTNDAYKALTGKGGTLTRMANGEIPMSKALLEMMKDKPKPPPKAENPIVVAARKQLGNHEQCSAVVNNSLKAVAVNAVEKNVSINGKVTYYLGTESFFKVGKEVPYSSAQPGDVLYYPNNGMGGTHVAIYIGGGMAVHGNVSGTTMIMYSAIPGLPLPRVVRIDYDREKYGY